MKKEIKIILPKKIAVLRDGKDAQFKQNQQEFNIYFKNIILPYKDEYDIQVICKYGRNHGTFWRLSKFPHDEDLFDFEIVIYNEYGEKIASKKSVIELYDRSEDDEEYKMLFVGDSITFAQKYIAYLMTNLNNLKFVGSRRRFGYIAHEGRGGWSYKNYFTEATGAFVVSPFLFPKNVDNYMGSIEFFNNIKNRPELDYFFSGFEKHEFIEGAIYGKDEVLYKYENGDFAVFDENPTFEINIEKYVKRYNIEKFDCVSLLMGANDLQNVPYEESKEAISQYIDYTEKIIKEFKKYDKDIKIIVNLPIIGAESYAWAGSKRYRFNIINASYALINKFGDMEDDGIYISPMLLCIDPENGFPKKSEKANIHSETLVTHHCDSVHPNMSGYCQMGDAISGVIQKIRK